MREQIEQRRAELQAEYEKGQQVLASMNKEQQTLEQTLLRISGAMLVLQELLAQPAQEGNGNGNHSRSDISD